MPSGSEAAPRGEPTPERRMTVDERVELVQNALEQHGEGFLAWLIRGIADCGDPDMVEQFQDRYAGWFPDRRTLMATQLASFDWLASKADFLDSLGLPPGALEVDEGSFWEYCKEIYAVEERLGGVHVFTR